MRKAKRKKRWRASKKFVGLAMETFCVALANAMLSTFQFLYTLGKKN